jgi:hypothetical protein
MVDLTVHVDDPECVPELLAALRRSGCRARQIGPTVCRVVHSAALDEREARVELAFFLRAWEAGHPVARVALA